MQFLINNNCEVVQTVLSPFNVHFDIDNQRKTANVNNKLSKVRGKGECLISRYNN